jgi:hypothetical protein
MRGRGGYIGFNRVPAASAVNSAASGVWTLREAESLKRGGTWPVVFVDPTSITGLQLWLDAADSATLYDATSGGSLVAADGGVARWEDKSGNGRHATQSTSANRPARKTAIQGGRDVLRFDGNDFLNGTSTPGTGNSRTVFGVAKYTGSQEDSHELLMIGLVASDQTSRGFLLRHFATFVSGDVTTNNIQLANNVTLTVNQFIVRTCRQVASTGAVQFWQNGTSYATTGTLGSFSMNAGYRVGSRGNAAGSTGGLFHGDLCELIVYNSELDDANRTLVENYLLAKWGIT